MRKKLIAFLILIFIFSLSGCANTFRGVREVWRGICKDTKANWQKVRHADQEFEDEYW